MFDHSYQEVYTPRYVPREVKYPQCEAFSDQASPFIIFLFLRLLSDSNDCGHCGSQVPSTAPLLLRNDSVDKACPVCGGNDVGSFPGRISVSALKPRTKIKCMSHGTMTENSRLI